MKQKGFTLIELLVVIAIIGILASVVLASLNSARTRAADSAIKADLGNVRAQADLWYDSNNQAYASAGNSYPKGVCPVALQVGNILSDGNLLNAVVNAYTGAGGVAYSQCVVTPTAWAVAVQLKSGGTAGDATPDAWCSDSLLGSRSYTYAVGETIADVFNVTNACK